MPLLAPTGSTISLTVGATALPVNGAVTIIAQVLESAGVPPHSGTEVTFTTTLGTIQPATAHTDVSGRVTVIFSAGTSNGTATIGALSGGASTGTTGAVRIAIGTAGVGGVCLAATPNVISANGGVATITSDCSGYQRKQPRLCADSIYYDGRDSRGHAFLTTNASGIAVTTVDDELCRRS